jgi:FkbM family methyltransferase
MKNAPKDFIKKILNALNNQSMDYMDKLNDIAHLANEAKNGRYYELGDGSILTTIYTGQILAVDQHDLSLAPHLILKGEWEKELTQRCEMIVREMENPVIFDIGANFGWYGLTLSRFSSNSHIHFFEANPDISTLLSKTVLVNGLPLRAKINNLAVSDKSGQALYLEVPKLHKGSSSVCGFNHDLSEYYENKEDFSRFEVKSIKLDDYCKTHSIHAIDFMKIDVEGAEEKVIIGATDIVSKSTNLSIMLEWNIGRYTDKMTAALKCFNSCGAINCQGDWIDLSSDLRETSSVAQFEELVSKRLNTKGKHYDLFLSKKKLN